MFITRFNAKLAVLVGVAAIAIAGVANAYPSNGGSCTTCHTKTGGQLTVTPDPISIQLAASGLLTFKVTQLKDDDSVISVQGLDNPLLQASIGSGSNKWTLKSNLKYGQSFVSNTISEKGSYLMNLAIGAGATPGIYPITVMFADEEKGCTTIMLTLAIGNAQAIPEPAMFGMFVLGAATVSLRRPKR